MASATVKNEIGHLTVTNGKYYGGIKDGNMHGNGKKHGKGKNSYANGSVYEGYWKDDKKHGTGKYSSASGDVYEGYWKDGEKQETVEPKNCYAMVSFNNAASGKEAEELANFLTKNGRPTFCTRIYCPENIGSWRQNTKLGAAECKYYISLLTNGWQKSGECQFETKIVVNRHVQNKVEILPVFFDDFDEEYDQESGHYYKLTWQELQTVWRNSGDWKQTILNPVPKA